MKQKYVPSGSDVINEEPAYFESSVKHQGMPTIELRQKLRQSGVRGKHSRQQSDNRPEGFNTIQEEAPKPLVIKQNLTIINNSSTIINNHQGS